MNRPKKQFVIDENCRRMLSNPEKWRIVSSLFPPEHRPVNNRRHAEWLKSNSDKHTTKELLLVLEGSSLNSLNQQIFPATPGTIFLFDANEEHDKAYSPETKKAVHLWLFFMQHRIIVSLMSVNNGRIQPNKKTLILENAELCNVLNQEWGRLKNSPLNNDLRKKKLRSLLTLLFLELMELDMSSSKTQYGKEEQQAKIVNAIRQHIANTAGKGLTIEKIARLAGYSKFHFLRTFKRHTGQKIHECINLARLKKMQEMLARGSLQKEISEELGFSCPSAFSLWYRQHKKGSPVPV